MAAEQSSSVVDEDNNNNVADTIFEQSLISVGGEVNNNDNNVADTIAEIIAKLPGKSEILLEIFARLPPSEIFNLRCVSKGLLDLTTQPKFAVKHSLSYKRNTITAFLCQSKDPLDDYDLDYEFGDPILLPIEHKAGPLPDPFFNFLTESEDNDVVELLDSCNGLILCSSTDLVTNAITLFVCNPLTKEKVSLPHPRRPYNRLHFALLADFNSHGYLQYKVLCLFRRKLDDPLHPCSKLLVLSSTTVEWEEIEDGLPPVCYKTMMGSKVYLNGTMYWDCLEGHILVYHLNVKKNRRCYELIEAPKALLGRCLWKSRDKLVCYCHGFPDKFPAWLLSVNEKKEYKWEVGDCEEFETLTDDVSREYTEGWTILFKKKKANIPRIKFKIIGYEPETKTMFLTISHLLFSYRLPDRNLILLGKHHDDWCWAPQQKFHSLHRFLPYVHSLGRMQTRDIAEAETDSDNEEEEEKKTRDCSAAIDEVEELASSYEKLANNVKGR